MNRSLSALLLLIILMAGCPGEDPSTEPDAGEEADVERADDAGEDVEPDGDVSCETFCEDEPVYIEVAAEKFAFTRAAYGLSSPQQTESGAWEIHLEAWEGGFTGCPEQDSPTPARQLILSGLGLFEENEVQSDEEGVSLVLLDYQGEFVTTETPVSRASVVRVLPVSGELCTECVGGAAPPREDGEIVLRVEATFTEGELKGEIVARHCESLDLP